MDAIFELLFYSGLILTFIGAIWLLRNLFGRRWDAIYMPIGVVVLGMVTLATPAILSRYVLSVDLGRLERIVDDERHITLTGWDGDSYQFLEKKTDTVVLQMANADVDDATVQLLLGMRELRELDLNDTSISDRSLETLAKLTTLQTLRLRGTNITDAGFQTHLMPLTNIKNLDLRTTNVSAETIESWKSNAEGRRVLQDNHSLNESISEGSEH